MSNDSLLDSVINQSSQRISRIVEAWFLSDPLLFAAWTSHRVVANPAIQTIRVARGEIQYNPDFITSVETRTLRDVLKFETMRILLGHPYSRRMPDPTLSYGASNIAVQECLRTRLSFPRAHEAFDDDSFDHQYFEFYYRELFERKTADEHDEAPKPNEDVSDAGADSVPDDAEQEPTFDPKSEANDDQAAVAPAMAGLAGLEDYTDPASVGIENTQDWDDDDLREEEIHELIRDAEANDGWGSIQGAAKQRLIANLKPRLDYQSVLRSFRQNVRSVRRKLTRMKPSRRYGFEHMGSRYDLRTRLLFAVDVSGSMTHRDLQIGFSIIGGFFQYGIESIDVVWFDTELRGSPQTLRRARNDYPIVGRGGTDFGCVIDFVDQRNDYDGVIIFTDGQAPSPRPPQNRQTKICWLMRDQASYQANANRLAVTGRTTFIRPGMDSQA